MTFEIIIKTEDLEGMTALVDKLREIDINKIGNSDGYTVISTPEDCTPAVPTQVPSVATVPTPAPVTPPTAVRQYTMQELSLATRPIVEAGRQQDVIDFLHSFKKVDGTQVVTIMDLPLEQYGAFATGLRQLGGKL